MTMLGKHHAQLGFGWNAATPLNLDVATDETVSLLMIRDTNGTPIVGLRLTLTRDGPEEVRGTLHYTIVIPEESAEIGLEVRGAPWR